MSEYKENTVGWWLSQLKEPLKSRAIGMGHASLGEYSPSLKEAVEHIYELGEYGERDEPFWTGVQKAFSGMQPVYGNLFLGDKGWEGYNMAKECAPDNWLKPNDGGEDKAIVDSPKKTTELFFYGGKLCNPFKEPLVISPSGEMNSVIVEEDKIKDLMNANPGVTFWPTNISVYSPAPIAFEWNDNSVIDFTTWNLKRIKLYEDRFGIENQDILDSFKRGDAPELWHQPEVRIPLGGFEGFNKWVEAHGHPNLSSEELLNLNEYPKILYDETFLYPGESPKPKDSWEVERAVVGYEEPKPIDTIEKKHELRIKNLEGQVKYLEDMVGSLSRSLEIISKRVLKTDDHGTR